MEPQTCPPPDVDADMRSTNDRLTKARMAYADAQSELIDAERAAKRAADAWLKKHWPQAY